MRISILGSSNERPLLKEALIEIEAAAVRASEAAAKMCELLQELQTTRCCTPGPCDYSIEPVLEPLDRAPKYLRKHRKVAPIRMSRAVSHNIRRGRLPREFKGRREVME